ncbi:DUF6455 family protein [uncultured Ruegeria sp.]|uniref:DUF6455 family protein n=1 Tax=uncultured Ruegeria sp. TaxID=259304 RepID=UPI0026382098|nr:DUF6455 family protein [uncultured Ruegeria sp.]
MSRLGEIMTHLRLVLRMAQVTGTDIVSAHQHGHLSQDNWADMVQLCRGCAWARDCPDWLDRYRSDAKVPVHCLNRERFAVLQAKLLRGSDVARSTRGH